jgi:hypothetical protein
MKTVFCLALLCLLPLVIGATPLGELARRERARRAELTRQGKKARTYSDADLEPRAPSTTLAPSRSPAGESREEREREAKRLHWRREREKLDRELARLDANIRRLEWRLEAARARRADRKGDPKARDLQEEVLRESLKALYAEREREINRFLERGRREGALPGWLREP